MANNYELSNISVNQNQVEIPNTLNQEKSFNIMEMFINLELRYPDFRNYEFYLYFKNYIISISKLENIPIEIIEGFLRIIEIIMNIYNFNNIKYQALIDTNINQLTYRLDNLEYKNNIREE